MTTCTTLMDILKPYVIENDYNAFEKKFNLICGTSPNHCRETWNAIQKVYIPLQICRDDVNKIAIDAFRPLISKQNETILPEVLPKVKSYLKGNSKGPLTRKKVEAFIDRAKGIPKLPPQNNKLVRCGFPDCMKGAYKPEKVEGVPLCPDCYKKIKEDPSLIEKLLAKPSVPERTTKKTFNPIKPTLDERKALMHPHHSKMEYIIGEKLKDAGIPFQTDVKFVVVETEPDFWLHKHGIFVYLDGQKVHMKREAKDDWIRERVAKREKVKIVGITYPDNTQKTQNEIMQKIKESIQ